MNKLHDIQQLLEEGRIEEALQKLRIFFETISAPTLQNNFTVLSSRYHYLKQDDSRGIIDDPTRRQERAHIINSFSELLSSLEKITLPLTPTAVTATPKNGRLLHNIPSDMVCKQKCHCLVRIAENDTLLLEGLDPNRAVVISDIRLKRIIGVQILKEDNAAFDITTISSEQQYIDQDLATEWHFDIKPLKEGRHKLFLKVAGYEKSGKNQVPREAIIEKEIHVEVIEKASILSNATIWEDTGLSFDTTNDVKSPLFGMWFSRKALSFLGITALAAVVMYCTFKPNPIKDWIKEAINGDKPTIPESIIAKFHTCESLVAPSVSIADANSSRVFTPGYSGDKMHWECVVPKSYLEGTVKLIIKDIKTNFSRTLFMKGTDFIMPIEITCKAVGGSSQPDFCNVILKTKESFSDKPYTVEMDNLILEPSDYTVLSPNTLKINNVKAGLHGFRVTVSKAFSCSLEKNITQKDSLVNLLCVPDTYGTNEKKVVLGLRLIDNQTNNITKINNLAIDGTVMPPSAYTYEGNDTVLINAVLEQNKNYRFNVDYTSGKSNCSGVHDSISIGKYSKIIDVNCRCIITPPTIIEPTNPPVNPPSVKPPPLPSVKVKPYWVRFKIDEKWKAFAKKNDYILLIKHNDKPDDITFKDLQKGNTWQLEYGQPTLSIKAFKDNYDQHIELFLEPRNKQGGQKTYKIVEFLGKKEDKTIKDTVEINCPFKN